MRGETFLFIQVHTSGIGPGPEHPLSLWSAHATAPCFHWPSNPAAGVTPVPTGVASMVLGNSCPGVCGKGRGRLRRKAGELLLMLPGLPARFLGPSSTAISN